MRPHGISIQSFHVYLPDLPTWVTVTFWTSPLYASLSAMRASLSGSCPSGYVFAIASSLPHLTMCDLQVAFGFVGNYAPLDFHHRLTTCPSYIKKGRFGTDPYDILFKSRRRGRHCFSLAHWERVRVREGFDTGRVRFFLARWERVRVREEFKSGCFRFFPRPLGEG